MGEEPLRELGQRVRALRLERHLTQERLAELSGLHYTYVSRIESGTGNVSITKLIALSRALGTSPSDLLDGIS